MLDSTLASSSGKLKGEKRNTRSLPLNEDQRKLIENNFNVIFTNLKHTISLCGIRGNKVFVGYPSVLAREALSYLPEIVKEWDQNKSNGYDFIKFATQRCVLRLIDEHRKLNRQKRSNLSKRNTLIKLKDTVAKEKGLKTEQEINDAVQEMGINIDKLRPIEISTRSPFSPIFDSIPQEDEGLEMVEWSDFIDGLVKKIDVFFKDEQGNDVKIEKRNLNSRIHRILLKEHIIPKFYGKQHRTLDSIANQLELSQGRLSQLIHGERMQRFIRSLYK